MDNKENKYDIKALAKKWMQGSLSTGEKACFEEWYASFDDEEVHIEESGYDDVSELKEKIYTRLMQRIEQNTEHAVSRPFFAHRFLRISAGAACLLAIATFGLLFLDNPSEEPDEEVAVVSDDVAPGGNRAILGLPNGQSMNLSDNHEGIVVKEGGVVYEDGSSLFSGRIGAEEAVEWYSVVVPYGGQYRVVLPDGSKVWLNSGTTLKYPTKFSTKSRQVELQGEAYFEITPYTAPDHEGKGQYIPFLVHTNHQLLEVLGTAFNINAYENEPVVRTTLLNGSVKVSAINALGEVSGIPRMLKPNEQAVLKNNKIKVKAVDTESEVAWINGIFNFDDLRLNRIMRQLERWYDVKVDYASLPNLHFTGSISKHVNLSEVLKMFETVSDIEFEIKGKILIISNKSSLLNN